MEKEVQKERKREAGQGGPRSLLLMATPHSLPFLIRLYFLLYLQQHEFVSETQQPQRHSSGNSSTLFSNLECSRTPGNKGRGLSLSCLLTIAVLKFQLWNLFNVSGRIGIDYHKAGITGGCPLIIYSCTSCSYSLSGSHLGCPAVGRPQILYPGGSITSQWGLLGHQHWWYPPLSLSPEPVQSTQVLCVWLSCQSNNIPAHTRLSI